MDLRRDYVAPTIAAEDVLEQTSLACQVTQFPFDEGNFAPRLEGCTENVTKGGAFFELCDTPFLPDGQEPPVALS